MELERHRMPYNAALVALDLALLLAHQGRTEELKRRRGNGAAG